jgi:hypothetical protein
MKSDSAAVPFTGVRPTTGVGSLLYRLDSCLFDSLKKKVTAHTEARLRQICTDLVAAQTDREIDQILPELQLVLEEHIRVAKESLESQAKIISTLDASAQA